MQARAYTDPDLFALEMDRIFYRAWMFVAHASQVEHPGSYRRTRIGQRDVIVVRGDDDVVRVLANACTHRGTRLCTREAGTTRRFVCPYHAWAFDLKGTLASVPDPQSYPDTVQPGATHLALRAAPRVDNYRGFIFASFAASGPSLTDFLGPMTHAIDNLVNRAPGGRIRIAGGHFSVVYKGNWKLHHENANDTMHPGFVHRSSVETARDAGDDAKRLDGGQMVNMMAANGFTPREWNGVELHGFEGGHSFMGGFYSSGILSPATGDAVTEQYRAALVAARGEAQANAILGMDRFNNLVWPNLNVNAQFHQIRLIHPVAVDRTIIEGYCFKLDGAPEAMFHRAVRFLSTLVSPASMIFSDDVEMFERVQAGLEHGDVHTVNAERGIDHDVQAEAVDGAWHSNGASELPNRVQARAWKHWMTQVLPDDLT